MTNETKLEPCPSCEKGVLTSTNFQNVQMCRKCESVIEDKPLRLIIDLRAKLEKVSRLLKMTMGKNFAVENHGSKDVREAVAIAEQVLKGAK